MLEFTSTDIPTNFKAPPKIINLLIYLNVSSDLISNREFCYQITELVGGVCFRIQNAIPKDGDFIEDYINMNYLQKLEMIATILSIKNTQQIYRQRVAKLIDSMIQYKLKNPNT